MNEMIREENNEIVLAEEVMKDLKKFQKAKLKMDIMQEELKEKFRVAMENNGIDKWVSPDGSIVVNYFQEKTSKRLDTTKLKEEDIDTYNKYLKDVTTKSFVKLTIK